MFKRMTGMKQLTAVFAVAVAVTGCGPTYEETRPPADTLDRRDRGLQSKDVVDASDQVAMELLALPEMNQAGRQTVVVTDVANDTSNPYFNYDIFIRRLSTNIARNGRDRIMLLDRARRISQTRSAEIEDVGGRADTFGQGDGGAGTMGVPQTSVQPQWELWGRFTNLPNRGTDYYFGEFTLTNLQTREVIPMAFEVRVGR